MRYKLSVIIAVLDSHEVVRRQIYHFLKMGFKDVEFIIIDDGSEPAICIDGLPENFYIYATNDKRKWSQPCARNTGWLKSHSEKLLFTDIDHILTREAIEFSRDKDVDKIVFPRRWGILNKDGSLNHSMEKLFEYGLSEDIYNKSGLDAGMHHNTFMMKASLFCMLGGYTESFCGKYGGDDTDLNRRYSDLVRKKKKANPHIWGPHIYVYPDPRKDIKKVFHSLRR